jgi:nitroreductase
MSNSAYSDSLIYRRHSVRKFTAEAVRQEQLDHLLHAGMAGPSAHNTQPWSFIVLDDRTLIDKIAEFHPYANMLREATLAIVPCVIKDIMSKNIFYQQDLGACVENILLAAAEAGLGACWCGVHPNMELSAKFISLLKIPDTLIPFCVIAVGQPGIFIPPSDRYDESRVHRNSW